MTSLALLVLLAAGDAEFEQSRGATVHIDEAQRLAPRIHGAVGAFATISFNQYLGGVAGGFNGEVGVVLADRFVVAARALFASIYVYTTAGLNLGVDWLISEHFSVGVGVGLGFTGFNPNIVDVPPSFSVQVPFRVEYAVMARAATKVERSSFVFFLELSPGHEIFPPNLRRSPFENPPGNGELFVGIAMLGFGWSWR